MPKAMEQALKRTARKRGYSKKRTGAYVFGTMRKHGWTPGHAPRRGGASAARARGR